MTLFRIKPLITVHPTYKPLPTRASSILDFKKCQLSPDEGFLFTCNRLGKYPKAGPHMLLYDSPHLSEHIDQVKKDILLTVPSGFSGAIIIDYSVWSPLWSRTRNDCKRGDSISECGDFDDYDYDFQDDWADAWDLFDSEQVRQWQSMGDEHYYFKLAQTYEDTCKEFFLATLEAVRSVRPEAKVGFAGQVIASNDMTQSGIELQENASMRWLHEASDIIVPKIDFDIAAQKDILKMQGCMIYAISSIGTAWSIAQEIGDSSKRIYPLIPLHFSVNGNSSEKMLPHAILQKFIDWSYSESCHGCFIWHQLVSDNDAQNVQSVLDESIRTISEELQDGIFMDPSYRYEQYGIFKPEVQALSEPIKESPPVRPDEGYTAAENFSSF